MTNKKENTRKKGNNFIGICNKRNDIKNENVKLKKRA
jgi:hypothetical protein